MEIVFHNEDEFNAWFDRLHINDQTRIVVLLDALALAQLPLSPPQGRNLRDGLYELKSGSGHRIYYAVTAGIATVLTQGNKSSQSIDMKRARNRK